MNSMNGLAPALFASLKASMLGAFKWSFVVCLVAAPMVACATSEPEPEPTEKPAEQLGSVQQAQKWQCTTGNCTQSEICYGGLCCPRTCSGSETFRDCGCRVGQLY